MTDLSEQILPTLTAHRLPGLQTGDGFVHPFYAGRSILNIPDSLCQVMGFPGIKGRSFSPDILEPLKSLTGAPPRRVVLILMDALSLHRFVRWKDSGKIPIWNSLLKGGVLTPLTSVFPSTTSTALTTLWSGLSPAEHGMVGYELWLKEYGVVANMISHAPMNLKDSAGTLEKAGFDPESILPHPTLGAHLADHGVKPIAFQHYTIARSGLSRMYFRDLEVHPFGTPTELWINIRELLESQPDDRLFVGAYWGQVDHFSHVYGPDDGRPEAELESFSFAFERNFLKELSPEIRRDTLLILTADHGQIATTKDPYYDLKSHPNLNRLLHIKPTGENRAMYLFIRPGQTEAVRAYLDRAFKEQFTQLDPMFAVKSGLFGPGEPHPQLPNRLGDLLVLARGDSYLWWGGVKNPILGRHGGLSPDEMLVPFLAARL